MPQKNLSGFAIYSVLVLAENKKSDHVHYEGKHIDEILEDTVQ